MIMSLIVILIFTLLLPFIFKSVEHNLEVFLFIMGILAAAVSGMLSMDTAKHILENTFLYMITGVVLAVSLIFKRFKGHIRSYVDFLLMHMDIRVFAFLLVVVLGLVSSIITAIIAALVLSEIIMHFPVTRKEKIRLTVIACFSIGIGAALTPVGEPISTVIVSKLNEEFTFIIYQIGLLGITGIFVLGLLGAVSIKRNERNIALEEAAVTTEAAAIEARLEEESETYREIFYRTIKIFLFVIALELLGLGLKPIIDSYIIGMDSRLLYWGNTMSAFLDNATLASAEISPQMDMFKIRGLLTSLLISGGILIPGNVPNIITSGKLKIKSSEWAKVGVPLGLTMLAAYYVVLFVV